MKFARNIILPFFSSQNTYTNFYHNIQYVSIVPDIADFHLSEPNDVSSTV